MKIEVWFCDTSKPRIYEDVVNTFQEGQFFCVQLNDKIYKYPLEKLFRVVEYIK